jgi:1-acyl-sn-glycerol-3-phosphate acyltransferase
VAVVVRLVTAPFDRRLRVLHQLTCFWASLYTWCNPVWRVTVRGRARAPQGAYVIVANHQSFVDILVLFRTFLHFKWVSKVENFRIPFIGWNMSLNGYVPLRRGDRESVAEMFVRCRELLAEGSSVAMFPEGTRSRTGHMGPFKPGAFQLARDAGVGILPVAIRGSAAALPKRGVRLRGRHRIELELLAPLSAAEVAATESAEALSATVRERLAVALGEPSGR